MPMVASPQRLGLHSPTTAALAAADAHTSGPRHSATPPLPCQTPGHGQDAAAPCRVSIVVGQRTPVARIIPGHTPNSPLLSILQPAPHPGAWQPGHPHRRCWRSRRAHKQIFTTGQQTRAADGTMHSSSYAICDVILQKQRDIFGLKAQTTKDTRIDARPGTPGGPHTPGAPGPPARQGVQHHHHTATVALFICRSRASSRAPVSRAVTVPEP